jgi:hypothetical protein
MKKIPKQSNSASPKYPFLTAYKEKEAVVMGLAPTGKYQQVLYNHIKKSSSISNAGSGNLVTIREMQIEKSKLKRSEVVDILNQLISVKLVCHTVCLEFDPYQRKLRTKSYFITHPPTERQDTLYTVFEEVLESSIAAVKSWIELRDSLKTDVFKKLLERQYSLSNASDYYEFGGSIINFQKEFAAKNFEVPVSGELLEYTATEVREKVIANKMGIPLPDNLVLIIKEGEILEHYEVAAEFMESKIIPALKTDPVFKQKVDKIVLDQMAHDVEKFASKTASFVAKKAREVKLGKMTTATEENPSYPGSLAIETILNLETQAERIYKQSWKKDCTQKIADFKAPLINPSSKTDSLMRFVKQTEILNYPKEVWQALIADDDLFYSEWETSGMTYHVFVSKDHRIFKLLVREMERLQPSESWKALALKTLIEENEDELKTLFEDTVFKNNYGKLLKHVYIEYMPWYFQFLFSFLSSFDFFKNYFFTTAKKKIVMQQQIYKSENEKKFKEEIQKVENEKRDKLNAILKDTVSNSISEILDRAYFHENLIPEMSYVKKFFPDVDDTKFKEYLQKGSFRVIELSYKDQTVPIVLYPVNSDWPRKKNRLIRILDKHTEVLGKEFATEDDKLQLLKVNKLKSVIESNTQQEGKKKSGGTDPYIRLDRKIKKIDEEQKIKSMEGEE